MMPSRPHRVVALAYPGMTAFELSIALEIFGLDRPELNVDSWYTIEVCSATGFELSVVGGVTMQVQRDVAALDEADTVIVPGWPVHDPVPPALIDRIVAAHQRGARVVSICSGAFVLAASGVLDGRKATTHWRYADLLAERYPQVEVNRDVLYVECGTLLTSAGSAAGIDLCLHLIRNDHGAAIANRVARRLVVPAHRAGGQAQYIETPVATSGDRRVHDVLDWLNAHLAEPVTLERLAQRAHLSPRQFTRRFRAITGQSPTEWLIAARIAASLPLLETPGVPIADVAAAVGYANTVTFRHHFRRRLLTSPSAYRSAFSR